MKRTLLLFGSFICLSIVISGCSGAGKKVIARVNGDIIAEDEFNGRCQRVSAAELMPAIESQGRLPGRAGEFAMQALIAEKLVSQYAAEKHATPTDAQITGYIAFAKKYPNPRLSLIQNDPFREESDWRNIVRSTLAYRNLVLQTVKQDPAELQKLYDQFKAQLAERDQYHIRMIDIKTEKKANDALAKLSKLPFETVALTDSEDPSTSLKNGDAGFVNDLQIPPPILEALKKLKPGEYTKQVIKVSMPMPPTAGASASTPVKTEAHYYIVQLVETKPGRTPTMEEVKPLLENFFIQQKDPGAFSRVQNSLREYQEKANIQINLKQYKSLEARFKRPAGSRPAASP